MAWIAYSFHYDGLIELSVVEGGTAPRRKLAHLWIVCLFFFLNVEVHPFSNSIVTFGDT